MARAFNILEERKILLATLEGKLDEHVNRDKLPAAFFKHAGSTSEGV